MRCHVAISLTPLAPRQVKHHGRSRRPQDMHMGTHVCHVKIPAHSRSINRGDPTYALAVLAVGVGMDFHSTTVAAAKH